MRAITLAWLELRRFKRRLRWLLPVLLVVAPSLFGGAFLWSNWDPYGRMDRIPVAVVNADQPVGDGPDRLDVGSQFVKQLKANRIFEWHFVGHREAGKGLADGRYYLSIEVPRDFSAKLATASDRTPQQAALRITKNDANGYLAGIVADTAVSSLRDQINSAARAAYTRAIFRELLQVRGTLKEASEASKQLVDTSDMGQQGASTLTDGVRGIEEGVKRVSDGAQRVAEASQQLDQQVSSVDALVQGELPQAVNSLVQASNSAVNSLSAITTATGFLVSQAQDNVTTLGVLGQRHPDVGADPAYQQAVDSARQLVKAARNADAEASRALSTTQEANTRALTLQSGIGPLQERIRTITTPTEALRTGIVQVTDGTDGLSDGLRTLTSSSDLLERGTEGLHNGVTQVEELINNSLDRIPPTNPDQVAQVSEKLGSPTKLETTNLNPAKIYAAGLAPLLFAVAAWSVALLAYQTFTPFNTRGLTDGLGVPTLTFAGWATPAVLGSSGVLLLLAAMTGLGLPVLHPLWTVGLLVLATLTFVSIGHFLRGLLGVGGSLLSLLLLTVQLVACGGLYPLETSPRVFSVLNPFMPMTYVVEGLRVTLTGGETEQLLRAVVVLAGLLVVFLVLTGLAIGRQRTWTVSRMYPRLDF